MLYVYVGEVMHCTKKEYTSLNHAITQRGKHEIDHLVCVVIEVQISYFIFVELCVSHKHCL